MDELLVFVTYRPAWLNNEGLPLSWAHYRYGMAHIAREAQRQQLQQAQAWRLSQQETERFDEWQRDILTMTEVPRVYGR